ncbi:MAG: bifunctional serine/threonine-protein kinase/formylglycine-generating enzyme family protein [Cyanobacteria bacterium P01_A01_bin.84]
MVIGIVLRDRYKILQALSSGGFGQTYLAKDLDLPGQPKCVVKHLKPKNTHPSVLEMGKVLFYKEAKYLYSLGQQSEQIPRLFAHFEEKGEFYLVQEFIDGCDLNAEITSGKKFTEVEVIRLLKEILEPLAFVHQQNIIHRDIKPSNLMRRYEDGKIFLIDFGALKEINTLETDTQGQITTTIAIGTPGYMPPEQANGKPKLCSDVYAAGMIAIQALTNITPQQLPEDSRNGEVVWRDWTNVSDDLASIITKMVRYNFTERYQTAASILVDLNPLLQHYSSSLRDSYRATQVLEIRSKQLLQDKNLGKDGDKERSPSNISPISESSNLNLQRRQVIKTLGLIGTGFGVAILGRQFVSNKTKLNKTSVLLLQDYQFTFPTVNEKGNIIKRDRNEGKYFIEDLGNNIDLEMIEIPGGDFIMGSPMEEKKRNSSEAPQHQVKISKFFIGKYPVTQAQYATIMGKNYSKFISNGLKKPVENVTWNEAVEFCHILTQRTGRKYYLPSEAQWEYACRGGTNTAFSYGKTITTDLVNFDGDFSYRLAPKGVFRKKTTPVGSFLPNNFGIFDMHGNVWEWCQDYWHENYQGAPTNGKAWLTQGNSDFRPLRGGCWGSKPENCRSAVRKAAELGIRYPIFGFRVAVSIE